MRNEQRPGYLSLGRIHKAFKYSLAGLRHAVKNEAAFQQELILIAVLTAACIALPVSALLKVLLLIANLLILIVELLNSAIDTLANKVCPELDPLIRQTKDTASAAVLLAFIPAFILWMYALYTLI